MLRYGTRFDGKALSGANRIGQRVIAGNAADLGEEGIQDPDRVSIGSPNPGNLSVSVPISEHLLVNVDAVPGGLLPQRGRRQRRGFDRVRRHEHRQGDRR